MKQKTVLQLISGLGCGGAEKILLDTSIQLKQNSVIASHLISFSNELGLLNDYVDNNIEVNVLKKDKSLKSFFDICTFSNAYVRNQKIDIVHAHMFHAMIIATILKICNPKIKVVFTSHNVNLGNRWRELVTFLLSPLRTIDILFSEKMKQYFHKSKTLIIPNAINIQDYQGETDKFKKFTFLAVGHLREAKNYPFLIQGVKKLKNLFDFQLLIAGEGELKETLQESIKKEKLEETIYLLGNIENIPKLLQQSHCLVMPSIWEGMPLVILEAGACKLPIISTLVGSIPSILNDDNAYPSTLDDFTDKMVDVYQNYAIAEAKAVQFHAQVIKNHAIEKMTEELEVLYLSL